MNTMEKNQQSSGFYHKGTGVYFPNRKSAIILMGCKRYRTFLNEKQFEWDNK